LYKIKNYIYVFIKNYLLKLLLLSSIYNELRVIKENLVNNFKKFVIIFIAVIFKSMFECIAFYVALSMFGADISFMASNYLWIASSLTIGLLLINYFGFFELILFASSALIIPEFNDMVIFGISFRILYILALICALILASFSKAFIGKKINK